MNDYLISRDELITKEQALLVNRRHLALHKQLLDPTIDSRIDELSIDPAILQKIKDTVGDYRSAVKTQAADIDLKPLLEFQKKLDGMTTGLNKENKAQLEALFIRVDANQNSFKNPVGLALSGGGIRSAAFNLGVLQALKRKCRFERIDYLSTVSGGGYIGTSLTYFMQNDKDFPFDKNESGKHRVAWIRRHASYLTPGDGLNKWALAAAALRGILINLFFLIPLWLLLFWLFTLGVITHEFQQTWLVSVLDDAATKLWPSVLTIFFSMLFLSAYRWRLNTKVWKEASRKIEHPTVRFVLWAAVIIAAFYLSFMLVPETIRDFMLQRWKMASLTFKLIPVFILIIVLGITLNYEENFRRIITEFLELLTWAFVFWALYVLIPPLLVISDFLRQVHYPPPFIVIFLIGVILLLKLLINYLFFTVLSSGPVRLDYSGHRYFSVQYGDLLLMGITCTLVGLIPVIDYFLIDQGVLKQWAKLLLSGVSIGGVISTLLGWFKRNKANENQGLVAILLHLGLALLILAAVLLSYRWAVGVHGDSGDTNRILIYSWLGVFFIFLLFSDINYVSMHRYYRNRLLEAFLKESETVNQSSTSIASDNLELGSIDITSTGAPYHLINTNLVTVGSSDNKLRLRGGDSFTFSPAYMGSQNTGWVSTKKEPFDTMNLATAMAISGAAVDPNTGVSRSWPLRLIMTWLNVRLGYWCCNPNPQHYNPDGWSKYLYSSWLWLVVKEIFGDPHEQWSYIRLSDGGHFENLGLYELLRRNCSLIIVSDAGADPNFTFSDLALAIERARVDFGVKIEGLKTTGIQPARFTECKESASKKDCLKLRLSKLPYAAAKIIYDDDTEGTLIYLKTTLFDGLGEDVLGYARQHKTFPDESTANQFFSEEQFEAYRELGYRAMALAIENKKI